MSGLAMIDKCPVTDCPAALFIWWQAYSTDETDDEARTHAARKLGVPQQRIELKRNGGCVLARIKKETKWTSKGLNETAQMPLNF